jgi:flavin-dependent dehydrogenase
MTHPTNHSHDVIVVGAGPAGATLAYELSRQCVDVLILEKERLPRYKACAGGITLKTAKLLGFDFSSVTRDTVSGAKVAYGSRHSFTKSYPKPLIHMVMRDEFDQLLVQRAREAGATLADDEGGRGAERCGGKRRADAEG